MAGGSALRAAVVMLAGPRVTIIGMVLLVVAVAGIYALEVPPTWALLVPIAILAVNLCAALVVNAALRGSHGLLIFHVALLVFLCLVLASRLTYLRGRVEVTQGTVFAGTLNASTSGPLHAGRLAEIPFLQGNFEIEYFPDGRRSDITSRVSWMDREGRIRDGVAAERVPFVRAGYRLAPTSNKGFAAVLRWRPRSGRGTVGSVHFPSYPANAERQSLGWELPGGGPEVWTALEMEPILTGPNESGRFRLPPAHHLVVRRGLERWELAPGERIEVPGGTLEYIGLTTWMGYTVFHDLTVPWLVAAALVGCLGLGMHYAAASAAERPSRRAT